MVKIESLQIFSKEAWGYIWHQKDIALGHTVYVFDAPKRVFSSNK